MKRLVVEKVVPTIIDYIGNFYNKTYGRDKEQMPIYATGSLRDLAVIALSQLAIGRENMKVFCQLNHLKSNLYTKMVDDYLFDHGIQRHTQVFSFDRETIRKILPKLHYEALIDDRTGYRLYTLSYVKSFNRNCIHSSGFGECYALETIGNERVCDTCIPLYWFSDDEVLQILEYIYWNTKLIRNVSPIDPSMSKECMSGGLYRDVLEGIFEPFNTTTPRLFTKPRSFSYQYRDTEFDRALKIARSDLNQLDKLGSHELFKIKMDHIPYYTNNDLVTLTYFFMGECYGCYRNEV